MIVHYHPWSLGTGIGLAFLHWHVWPSAWYCRPGSALHKILRLGRLSLTWPVFRVLPCPSKALFYWIYTHTIQLLYSTLDVVINVIVRNLNVRPDSSLWHNRDNSVLLGSCAKQGQGLAAKGNIFRPRWHVKDTFKKSYLHEETISINITWSSWGIKIRHPLWPICWTG